MKKTHTNAVTPTRRACEAAVLLGVAITRDVTRRDPEPIPDDAPILDSPITLITGPSGGGKTTLLARANRAFADRDIPTINPDALRPRDRPAVDLLGKNTTEAMRALARVGLGDLRAFVRRPRELSAGQLARLRLALAIDRAPKTRAASICIDEFAASLDDLTARTHATLIRRLSAARPNLRFVIATNRGSLAPHLAPNIHLRVDLAGRVTRQTVTPAPFAFFDIQPGTRDDLSALAHHHYRSGPPATVQRVLRAVDRETGTLAGVLATSRPTLNGRWRRDAFPGRFDQTDKSERARAINRELRTISRVIVDPRFRALGVAKALVRAYLRDPETPCTEAPAAMGAACPFFSRAGMSAHTIEPTKRDARLARRLEDANVEPWRLATPDLALQRAQRALGEEAIDDALRTWARASRATSRLTDAPIRTIFARAASSLAATPVAYAHTKH